MKKFILTLCTSLTICTATLQAQWVEKLPIPGARDGSVSWYINNKYYVVGGNGFSDLRMYNPATNTWSIKASIPQGVTGFGMGFVINGKGYLCGGVNAMGVYYGSLLEYDPATNQWTTKAPLPGGKKLGAAFAFAVGNKGYVGGGDDGAYIYSDVYEYDPATNSWAIKNQFTGGNRDFPYSFSIGNTAYVGGGGGSGGETPDLWEYDQANDDWIAKADFPGTPRQCAVSFASSTKGYVGLGQKGYTAMFNDVFTYDPANDSWDTLTSFPGSRAWPIGFATDSAVYVCTGWNFSSFFSNLYKLTLIEAPTTTVTGISHAAMNQAGVSCYPNPNNGELTVSLPSFSDNTFIEVYNSLGQLMKREKAAQLNNQLQLNDVPKGIYIVRITEKAVTVSNTRIVRQ